MNIINKKQLITLFSIVGLLLISSIALAKTQLIKLHINPLTDGQFELKFEFDSAISGYADTLHYRPNQLIVDIKNASSALKVKPIKIEKSTLKSVEVKHTTEGLRLIITLDVLMPYRVVQEDKLLFIHFGKKSVALKPASDITSKFKIPSVTTNKKTPKSYVNSIKSIDFKRGSEGQGKLLVYLDNAKIAVDIRRRDQQLIAEFQSTYIANEFLYIMDVVDFSTVVNKVETFKKEGKTRFIFDIKGEYNYRYDQLDTLLTIEISPKRETKKERVYKSKAISLNFQDIPVRTVLQLIADFNGFNLVITDSVSGNITLRLDDVPWKQALDIILRVKGLGKRMDGNILMIAPAVELITKEREQLKAQKEVEELAPLSVEFIQINYAKVADIASMLSNGNISLLSSRGAVSIDTRTNTLLLKDTVAVIDAVKEMIEVLDIPVRQVVIEARMVTVSDSVAEELGIKWGIGAQGGTSAGHTATTSGTLVGVEGIESGAGFGHIDDRLNVNLPVIGAAGTIAFQVAKLADGQILDLELSALEKENKAEIIASPRITTANQQTAYIEQGTEIPYVESASSGATSVRFKKAVLSLQVTPQITPDNKVILDLLITQNSKGEIIPTGIGKAVSIDTQEISTQVLVENGETIVLGGIYQQRITTGVQKVPILGDIPYLGYLFRTTIKESRKAELLIFVTPRIVVQTKY